MTKPFSAWREGLPYYGGFFLAGGAVFLVVGEPVHALWLAIPLWLLAAGSLFFFRDPRRSILAAPDDIVSPADGTVVAIEELTETPHYDGPCKRVSIFLSVFNVHVNRAPDSACVQAIKYAPGQFKNAMKAETSQCNESNAVWFSTPHGPMTVRQISGAIARRIVCVCQEQQALAKGDKFGMIKFGSRTELYLAPSANIAVELRQKVRAGATTIARF